MLLSAAIFSMSASGAAPVNVYEVNHDRVQQLVSDGHIRTLDECLTWLAKFCDVQLLDAQLFQDSDQWRYDLHLKLAQGKKINLQFNAQSGKLKSLSQLPSECTQR